MADSSKWHRYANNSTKATNSSHSAHITKNNYNKFEGGGKTIAQTPAPKSDRIYGSKKNIEGSAATEGSNIELSEKTVETLKDKLKEFKEKHPNVENITLEDLKKVYRRGSGAYSKSHRPTITGGAPNTRAAWSFARVNKFLEKAAGHKVKKAYVQDDDLIKYEDGGLTHSLEMAMTNLKKNGIVLKNSGITVIAYNTGNQERKPSLYSKKVIYDAIPSKKVASKIIQEVDKGNYENFNQSKIDDYKKSNLIIVNQNEVVYDSSNTDIRYEDGGLNKDIVCKNCGWSWNTADSDESDKYVCHKCGFDNSPYYEHDGIKKENNMEERVISLPDTYSNEERLKEILNQQGYDIVKSNNDANLNNNDMKEYLAEGGHVKGDGVKSNDAKHGGYFEGKSHAEGGIKAVNVDTKQPIEVEGNEVVINKRSVADNTLHEFNGRKMTNKQILSEINQSGGGVAFAKGGQTDNDRHDFNENKYVANQDRYKYLSSDVYANGGTIHDHELNDLEMSILAKLGHSTLRKTEISAEKLHEIKGIEKKGIVYSTPSKKHKDCFDVRLTDFGMELLDGIELKYDSKFAEGGEMDCGCSHNKYRDGGETDVFPPIIFSVSSKEDGKKLHREAINYTGGNNFSIKQSGDKDYYYANTEAAFELLNELYKQKTGLKKTQSNIEKKYFQGIDYKYANQFEVNKAIEEFVATKEIEEFTPSEKAFIGYYAGYGGLEKLGGEGKGLLYEYFTPSEIAKKMWGLAYKYGFKKGKVLEPSCGIGEFLKYAPDQDMLTGYEINKISAKICKILYPKARIESKYFETLFIKNNNSIRGDIQNVEKYSLIIGNPPYGSMGGIYAGMGEKSYSKANNYIEYFIFRGLDLLESGGLLIYIIGTEVAAGGTPFLKQEMNPVKSMIAEKADLIDAYRLPNGLFETTDVLTDIIVLKKK